MVRVRTAAARRAACRLLSSTVILTFGTAAWADIPSRACRNSKKPEDVVTACTDDLKQPAPDQNRAATLNARAKAYEAQDMAEKAKADYDQAVALAPGFVTWFNRGQFFLDASLVHEAADDLSKAIALYDRTPPQQRGDWTEADYLQAHYQRGQALRRDAHYAEAVADYSLVIAAQPRNDEALTQRAIAYAHLGKLDEDIADLTRLLALKRPDPVTLYNRGLAYSRKGDDAHALEDFNDCITRGPGLAVAYVARGATLEHMGQPAKALADYHMAIQVDPQLSSATAALARLEGK